MKTVMIKWFLFAVSLFVTSSSLKAGELSQSDTMFYGSTVTIPAGWTNVPGYPFVVRDSKLQKYKDAQAELDRNGFVERKEGRPLFETTKQEFQRLLVESLTETANLQTWLL